MLRVLMRELLPKGGFLFAASLNTSFSCHCTSIAAHSESDQFADLVEHKSQILSNNLFPIRSISWSTHPEVTSSNTWAGKRRTMSFSLHSSTTEGGKPINTLINIFWSQSFSVQMKESVSLGQRKEEEESCLTQPLQTALLVEWSLSFALNKEPHSSSGLLSGSSECCKFFLGSLVQVAQESSFWVSINHQSD